MSTFTEFLIGLVCILAFVLIYQRHVFERNRYELDECHEQRMDAFRRSLDAAGDANAGLRRQLQVACEELGASQLQVESLAKERDDLLQTNLELQQAFYRRGEVIKYLSPYQAIRSTMPWGKN